MQTSTTSPVFDAQGKTVSIDADHKKTEKENSPLILTQNSTHANDCCAD
jgi:hypothetical protein